MNYEQTARQVLEAVGGSANVLTSTVCMTRLRLTLRSRDAVDTAALDAIEGVLGAVERGRQGLEVVFRPLVLDQVFQRFAVLAHANTTEQDLLERPQGALRVVISPGRKKSYEAQATATIEKLKELAAGADSTIVDENDIDVLRDLLAAGDTSTKQQDDPSEEAPHASKPAQDQTVKNDVDSAVALIGQIDSDFELDEPEDDPLFAGQATSEPRSPKTLTPGERKVLVLNGPNINMLGIREPDIYGRENYADLVAACQTEAERVGFSECWCYQSNHEGDLVDEIQHAFRVYDGIVFNPGAYTHTSIALLDALKAVDIPCVEVHISAVDEREDFRQRSFIRAACFETVSGLGIEGYRKALRDLWAYLEERDGAR